MGNSDSHQTNLKAQPYTSPAMSTTTSATHNNNNNNNYKGTVLKLPTFTESFVDQNEPEFESEFPWQSPLPLTSMKHLKSDSIQSSSTGPAANVSKLLYYMDSNTLATLIRYVVEHESFFKRHKHHSLTIYNAIINYRIKGKMLSKYTRDQFCDELPWIKVSTKSLLYDRLRELSDDEINTYLSKVNQTKVNQTPSKTIQLPAYLAQIDMSPPQRARGSDMEYCLSSCTAQEFQIFVYILCKCTCAAYSERDIETLLNVLIVLGITGAQFMQFKRTDFCRKLKPYNIKAAIASKLYKALLSNSHNIYQYMHKHNISLILDKKAAQIYVASAVAAQPMLSPLTPLTPRPVLETKYNDEVVSELVNLQYGTKSECIAASAVTINYWDINEVADTLNINNDGYNDGMDGYGPGFIYNLCSLNGYNKSDIEAVLSALSNVNNSEFMEMKRIDFVRKLKPYGIKGGKASKIYKLIMENKEEIVSEVCEAHCDTQSNNNSGSIVEYSTDKLQLDKDHSPNSTISEDGDDEKHEQIESDKYDKVDRSEFNVAMCNEADFVLFVLNFCIKHEFNAQDIKCITSALSKMSMNGEEFMGMKRVKFCRNLREYEIKSAVASKLYKLIMEKHENIKQYLAQNTATNLSKSDVDLDSQRNTNTDNGELCAYTLSKFAVCDFEISANKMLHKMNECMKKNMVNGMELVQHFENKRKLEMYLEVTVPRKCVNVLCGLLWNEYERNNDINTTINTYDRKQLLKYFIVLYMYHVKCVVIKHDLNENKFMSLKRKEICDIFIGECGFSIGVATKIVDKIYNKINKSKQLQQ